MVQVRLDFKGCAPCHSSALKSWFPRWNGPDLIVSCELTLYILGAQATPPFKIKCFFTWQTAEIFSKLLISNTIVSKQVSDVWQLCIKLTRVATG